MDEMLASAKKEVLIEMVKLAQKRGMSGSKGTWKEFLSGHDKKFGTSLSDPSRRTVDTLVAFVKTFTKEDDLKFFEKVLQCHSNRSEVEQLNKISPDKETAEQRLIRFTLEHPLYPTDYSFPSHEEEWLIINCKKKSKFKKSTAIIAIDCEMVLCEDGTEALAKVCAVDRDLQVKLDETVNPNKSIADYRTTITGITAKDLEGVTYSLKDVQKSMRRLLSHGTILVGQSLNNDLQAMKIDYARVIDTSYIFKYANGLPRKRASLSFLCKAILGYELREDGNPHNCMDDACAAMKLVLARLEGKIGDVISEEVTEVKEELDVGHVAKLFIHRIPIDISAKELQNILPGDFTIEVKGNKKLQTTYSVYAIFGTKKEAGEAYENLEGELKKDTHGRPQKLVKFELDSGKTGNLYVCKTINHNDSSVGQVDTKKRLLENEETSSLLKKCKTDQTVEEPLDNSTECEEHTKEIERLKKELSHRDQEISSLNKIIAALARKQRL